MRRWERARGFAGGSYVGLTVRSRDRGPSISETCRNQVSPERQQFRTAAGERRGDEPNKGSVITLMATIFSYAVKLVMGY